MKHLLILSVATLLLTGCATRKQRRERRAQRKIERAKELAPHRFFMDTVVVHDTIVIENVTVDTVTSIKYHDTTVIINNDRVVARYFYDTTRMEIHHDIQCKEIIKPIETRVVTEQFKFLNFWEKGLGGWNWIVVIGAGVLLGWRLIYK